jgi:3-hydroxyisobutyrate dehydrogenase
MRIGYVGLGAMGGALARHLVPKHTVTVFDLNASALAEFTALGACAANSCAELARDCEIVLLCLPRSSDVERVLFGPGGVAEGLAPGSIVVDQTSGVPDQTRAFARRLAEQGVAMMDAPVSGNQAAARGGTIAIIASGPRAVYDKAQPVLKDISPNVMYCGEQVGNGQMMKTVNNLMNVTTRFATLELVALGRKLGLPLAPLTEALTSTAGRSHTSRVMLPAIAEGRETVKFYLALQVKDMNQAITLGTAQGVPMPIGVAARSLLQIGLSSLGPNAQLEEMIGVVERMAGTRFVRQDGAKEGAR